MFNKVVIENVLGINNEIEIDFMATPKKKERRETVIDIEPNVSVNLYFIYIVFLANTVITYLGAHKR